MSYRELQPATFFVLRTPNLPLKTFYDFSSTNKLIETFSSNQIISSAILNATSSLYERLNDSNHSIEPNDIFKTESALLKYVIRMSTRSTPYGLFAGVGFGKIKNQLTKISLDTHKDKTTSRLDFSILLNAKNHISSKRYGNSNQQYNLNSTLYKIGDKYRYIETTSAKGKVEYILSEIYASAALEFLITVFNKHSLSYDDAVAGFLAIHNGQKYDDICHFLDDLIKEGVVQPVLPLAITGDLLVEKYLGELEKLNTNKNIQNIYFNLCNANHLLKEMDSKGDKTKTLQKISKELYKLPFDVTSNQQVQIDLFRYCNESTLSADAIAQLNIPIALMSHCNESVNPFDDFIKEFEERFGQTKQSLLKVLDSESGIPFNSNISYPDFVLDEIPITYATRGKSKLQTSKINFLQSKVIEMICHPSHKNKQKIKLNGKQLLKELDTSGKLNLPFSFSIMCSIYQSKETNQNVIYYQGATGPSSATLLGRFCHLDNSLEQFVKNEILDEERHSPDVIFAEIVHLPRGRIGNILSRPNLRKYEIVFLCDSSLDVNYQIAIDDLFVFVENNIVKLWSKRLEKRIIPRLSSAHNFRGKNLSIYSFLCSLQSQNYELPVFSLPRALEFAPFVPRVLIDEIIVSPKRWNILKAELEDIYNAENDLINTSILRKFQAIYRIDNIVEYRVNDNVLVIDLRNVMLVKILLSETKKSSRVILFEHFTSLENEFNSVVYDVNKNEYANQFVVPFQYKKAALYHGCKFKNLVNENDTLKSLFLPGSEWLSFHIYAENSISEELLLHEIYPIIESNRRLFKKWFFIKYRDPKFHLRLRFNGEIHTLNSMLLPLLTEKLECLIKDFSIKKVKLLPYLRELERYGGDDFIKTAESLFMIDSELIIKVLALDNNYSSKARLFVATQVVTILLENFKYNDVHKLELIDKMIEGFSKEFDRSKTYKKKLNNKYRTIRREIETIFEYSPSAFDKNTDQFNIEINAVISIWAEQVRSICRNFSSVNAPEIERFSIVTSLIHMHCNRTFKNHGRFLELIVYEILRKYLFSKISKNKLLKTSDPK